MKEAQKAEKNEKKLTVNDLKCRRPIPFGDVRKYYLGANIGTIVLLALCFHISVVAIALRTDSCVQLPNAIIAILLLCAVLNMIGHYSRTIAGYALSVVCCLVIISVMQFYNGGVSLASELPEYGDVFKDGAKSTELWILLTKVLAAVHLLLSIVFINSVLTVKEEPPLKGMNVNIQKFKDWLGKKSTELPAGQRAVDYWFVSLALIAWMLMASADTTYTGKYDFWAMGLVIAGCIAVLIKKAVTGGGLITAGFLVQCTMYQWRFGISIPVAASYLGLWISVLYFTWVLLQDRRRFTEQGRQWSLCGSDSFDIRIVFADNVTAEPGWMKKANKLMFVGATALLVLMFPVHEVLSTFTGSYMVYQKDNLPLYFVLPMLVFICVLSRSLKGYIGATIYCFWLVDALRNASPYADNVLFRFDSLEQHGAAGPLMTSRMNTLVNVTIAVAALMTLLCAVVTIIQARRAYHGNKEAVMD
ncbi:MAG: hypothetical protein J5643_06660 [Lachnospiraceae bacterium]|nr:hypothetical protein [Lachnospiraceae bacterium]